MILLVLLCIEETKSEDEIPPMVADEFGPTEPEPTETHIDSTPNKAQIKSWSSLPPTNKSSTVIPTPPRRPTRGDHYGLPEKGFELTRPFVFSYFQRMPAHYIDFKNNPLISLATKKSTKKKKMKKKN